MPGTPWTTIDNSLPVQEHQIRDILHDDPEGMFQNAMAIPATTTTSVLSLYALRDLNLRHAALTTDIYERASFCRARSPSPVTALRIVAQQPNIFRTTLIDSKPVESVLLGVTPMVGKSGSIYVIELGLELNIPYLRFRRAGPKVRWPDYDYWAFETSLAAG